MSRNLDAVRRIPIISPGIAAILLSLSLAPAFADTEALNQPHVKAGPYGQCYIKSVPDDYWSQKGRSHLYRVTANADTPVAAYSWFSQQIYLNCNLSRNGDFGISVVRFGPWSRGRRASRDDLAIAFYFGDRLLARYSTLDIAGAADNVEASVSHYMVIRKVTGYRWLGTGDANALEFVVETTDGRTLAFDAATGQRR